MLKYAANWFAHMIMSPQLCKNISIQIINEEMPHHIRAEIEVADVLSLPRNFIIRIDPSMGRKLYLMSLAHEIVHIKQMATGELKDKRTPGLVNWNGETINENEKDYWDYPWEIDAHGREIGLHRRFMNHLKTNKFDLLDSVIFKKERVLHEKRTRR
jgi:hypothetical protein